MATRIEQVKKHIHDNKKVYLVGAGCLVVGAVTALLVVKYKAPQAEASVINKIGGIHYKPTNIIQTTLERRGHPGNIIRCNETGEIFASQGRAAFVNEVSAADLSKHLRGAKDTVKGLTFTNLGEAV